MTQSAPRALRCDAQLNRTRIIDFARETFAETPQATLKSIARGAGVGQGTMYRHFPTSDHLLLAVYWAEIDELVDAAPRLLKQHEPVLALRLWLQRLAGYGSLGTAVSRAVAAATRADPDRPAYQQISAVLDELLTACRRAHRLRDGVTAHEVLLLMQYVWATDDGADRPERPDTGLLDIVMDGLCSRTSA
ncbi:TetR/AcrR family transcriptional regulator [Streptomyces sp. NPDC006012]|uniref:TetR/AcrR family transcriptional regulator n=1 Tax=Streptomyces sp. NPDC006012 TaxID=3364739 RepID=UPI0036B6BD58